MELAVPKVTFTSPTFSLATALKAMGMPVAFDGANADFHGLATNQPGGNLYISDVLQKAMIAMQETGVEAAAATAVIIDRTSGATEPPPQPILVTVNRPYRDLDCRRPDRRAALRRSHRRPDRKRRILSVAAGPSVG